MKVDTDEKIQTSNIDEQGNVLFLDQARLDRKVMGYERYKNKPNGLGIFNFLKTHVSARNWNWKAVLAVFRVIVGGSAWMKKDDLKSKIYKQVMMFSPDKKSNTSAIVMPLNVDISDKAEKVVVPVDIIKMALKKSSYIAGMNSCLCRDAQNCQDYPHDVACIFLGDGGRRVVKNGLARQFTYEEALQRIDRATELGLVGQSLWVEVEQLIWGFRNDELDKFMEICFCCPCCCVGMNLSRNASPEVKRRFHPVGWTAVPDRTKCIGCGKCVSGPNPCPQDAIKLGEDGKVEINQEYCVGCGICKSKCDQGVIKIKQTMPMRSGLEEYFLDDFNFDCKCFD